jgi:phosphoribosylglycinamide formyltransferase 1
MAEGAAPGTRMPVVVLISGDGSNLQALIDAQPQWPYRIVAVISNEADAGGLERAQRAGIATEVVGHRGFTDRPAYEQALGALIDGYAPGLVVLAGFMRILTGAFVDRYAGRMLNIHPSLLPKFRGLHTHRAALEAREREHGASVHFVTAQLDGGPVIAQAHVPVLPGDHAQTLAARVLAQEHRLYPRVVGWFAQGRLRLSADGRALLDGAVLGAPLRLEALESAI